MPVLQLYLYVKPDGKVKLVFNIKLVKSNIDLSGAVAGFIKGKSVMF